LGIEGKEMPSNKSYGEWGELLGDNVLASAILECGFCEFFSGIPPELEEAAMVGGCTWLEAFIRVILPVSRPGVVATAVWIVIVTWQEFMFALAFTTVKEMRTLPVGILDFIGQYGIEWGALMAGSVVVSLPIFAIFLFLQRQFIAGLTSGAVKG
jgi:multiple sugar transport system permease protein/raffinose/stachyose/melibiose transport system permease protein